MNDRLTKRYQDITLRAKMTIKTTIKLNDSVISKQDLAVLKKLKIDVAVNIEIEHLISLALIGGTSMKLALPELVTLVDVFNKIQKKEELIPMHKEVLKDTSVEIGIKYLCILENIFVNIQGEEVDVLTWIKPSQIPAKYSQLPVLSVLQICGYNVTYKSPYITIGCKKLLIADLLEFLNLSLDLFNNTIEDSE